MAAISDPRVLGLLDGSNLAHVVTVDKTGTPRVQPTMVNTDGDHVLLNAQEGRAWPKRLLREKRLTLSVVNKDAEWEYAEIQGTLAECTTDGAKEHLDQVNLAYTGEEYPHHRDDEVRLLFKIRPDRIRYVNLMEAIPGNDADAVQTTTGEG